MWKEQSPSDIAELIEAEPDNYVLLDVREAIELQIAPLKNALHIPMGEIPSRLNELDKTKTMVCVCKVGGRSAQVCEYLVAQGFEQVINMTGGINAWSEQVDSSVPLY